jgi:hypothetical protein
MVFMVAGGREQETKRGHFPHFKVRVARTVQIASALIKHTSPTLSLALSAIAVTVSVITYNNAEQRRKRDVPAEVIPKAYEKYYEMNKIELDKWYLTHMFVVPELYSGIKDIVHRGVAPLASAKRVEFVLHERAAADFVFTFYEQTLYQWDATRDKERKFINDTLSFLRGSLLRNPRLVYWWRERAGGLELSYHAKTRNDWASYILLGSNTSDFAWCDALGPFEMDVRPETQRSTIGSC